MHALFRGFYHPMQTFAATALYRFSYLDMSFNIPCMYIYIDLHDVFFELKSNKRFIFPAVQLALIHA